MNILLCTSSFGTGHCCLCFSVWFVSRSDTCAFCPITACVTFVQSVSLSYSRDVFESADRFVKSFNIINIIMMIDLYACIYRSEGWYYLDNLLFM